LLDGFGETQQTTLLEAANAERKNGNTTAFEYLQSIATVFDLRLRRLEALHQWNQAVIDLAP
jgi:outer membrane protein TolC